MPRNKLGGIVAGLLTYPNIDGRILILPTLRDKAGFLVSLLGDVLPDMMPHLFPHIASGGWLREAPYEHPAVLTYQSEKRKASEEFEWKVRSIERAISDVRDSRRHLHDLLLKDGDELKHAVHATLSQIGFKDVVDVDSQLAEGRPKEEDLRIMDRPCKVLLESKGMAAMPGEPDVMQLVKYLNRRMTEWQTFDIRGVLVVNHQRHLPPLTRQDKVFTNPQIKDAKSHRIGLMTTWDLFCLVRGMEDYNWPKKAVQELFYREGLVGNVPAHYRRIGVVVNFYEKASAVIIQLDDSETVAIGETLGVVRADATAYLQQPVESLQVDGKPIERAPVGSKVGIKAHLTGKILRNDLPVYVVET